MITAQPASQSDHSTNSQCSSTDEQLVTSSTVIDHQNQRNHVNSTNQNSGNSSGSMNPTLTGGGMAQEGDFMGHVTEQLAQTDSPNSFFKGFYDSAGSGSGSSSTNGGDLFDSVNFFSPFDPCPLAQQPTPQNWSQQGLLMPVRPPNQVKTEQNLYFAENDGNGTFDGSQTPSSRAASSSSIQPPPSGYNSQVATAPADSTTVYPGSAGKPQNNGYNSTTLYHDHRRMSEPNNPQNGLYAPESALMDVKPQINGVFGDSFGLPMHRSHSVGDPSEYLVAQGTLGPPHQPHHQASPLPVFAPGTPQMARFPTAEFKIENPSTSPSDGQVNGAGSVAQKAFVPCKVCGDKASGYHYGVTSCEGCKGFFRRSIQKQIEYRCLRDGKCMVFRLNRNRCQYCRFKKCLAVGMSRDSVRYGRVPKRSRDRMDGGDVRVSSQNQVSGIPVAGETSEADSELEKRQLALYDVILSVSQAHHSNCAFTDDKMKNVAQRPICFPLERCQTLSETGEPISSVDLLEQQKMIMWETMALYTTPEIQRVVEFAKRIPGFADLPQEDQLVLIKCGFFEVWLVRVARHLNSLTQSLTLADGAFVHRDQLDVIYTPDLVSAMFSFANSFNNLHLNDGEVGLFTAVVLLSQDRPSLHERKQVELLQAQLTEALKLQLSRSHSSDPQAFANLLAKIPELRAVGHKHHLVLGWYRQNWRRLNLPPLYAEIYDIAKNENEPGPMINSNDLNGNHGLGNQRPTNSESSGNNDSPAALINGNGYHHDYMAATGAPERKSSF